MSWKMARASDERETVLICEATTYPGIAKSLAELIERMEADWLADGFAKEAAIFIDINSSIGHLMVTWDIKGGGGVYTNPDWPTYYLELRTLWREAEDHSEGTEHFDRQAHFAICSAVEDMLNVAEKAGQPALYEVYELFEGSTGGSQRVVI